jgi:hypothetical protein
LSVDAVAFRPRVTVAEDGEVHGLDDLVQLPDPDLFEQHLLHPKEFTEFLKTHWKRVYTSLFASNPTDSTTPTLLHHPRLAREDRRRD